MLRNKDGKIDLIKAVIYGFLVIAMTLTLVISTIVLVINAININRSWRDLVLIKDNDMGESLPKDYTGYVILEGKLKGTDSIYVDYLDKKLVHLEKSLEFNRQRRTLFRTRNAWVEEKKEVKQAKDITLNGVSMKDYIDIIRSEFDTENDVVSRDERTVYRYLEEGKQVTVKLKYLDGDIRKVSTIGEWDESRRSSMRINELISEIADISYTIFMLVVMAGATLLILDYHKL